MGENIELKVGANVRALRTGLQSAKANIDDFKRDVEKAVAPIQGIGSAVSGIAGVLSVGAVVDFGKSILDMAGDVQDASDKLGVGVEQLQELNYAFVQSGAGAQDVDKALQKLSQTRQEALGGNVKLAETFERLGVSMEDLQKRTPDEIIMAIAASSKDAENPSERLADILDVLGKSGGKMAAGLNSGVDALKELRGEAVKLSTDDIAALDAAGDALASTWSNVKVSIAKAFLEIRTQSKSAAEQIQGAISLTEVAKSAKDEPKTATAKAADVISQFALKPEPERRAFAAMAEEQAKLAMENFRKEESNRFKLGEMDSDAAEEKRKEAEDLLEFEAKQYREFIGEQEKDTAAKNLAARKALADQAEDAAKFAMDELRQQEENRKVLADLDADAAEERRKDAEELMDFEAKQYREFVAEKEAKEKELAAKQKAMNAEIQENAKNLRQKEMNDFADRKMAGPDAEREAKRDARRRERLQERFGREDRLKNERHGRAEADVGKDPLDAMKGGREPKGARDADQKQDPASDTNYRQNVSKIAVALAEIHGRFAVA